ncbi:MAG: hypothetical protein QOI25_5053 [Mycobacterium sp.]|jgi:hypothetical protein|nr:hypothetical protein [Mycobacterium sp.]
MRMVIATAAVLVGSMAAAGCGGARQDTVASTTSVQSSPTTRPTAAPATTTASGPESGVSNGMEYTVTTTTIEGDSTDGRGSWNTEFGLLAGGDPAVVQAFNGASQAAAHHQVDDATKAAAGGTTPWTFESTGHVTFRPIAVAQIIYGSMGYGAHPTPYIGTMVIDSRSADPVMLVDLFTDQQAGLSRLSEQATKILAADGMNLGPDEPGAAPKAENFANWIPTAEGLEIHFAPYQFGVALPAVITVPWPALTDVLAPAMADIANG